MSIKQFEFNGMGRTTMQRLTFVRTHNQQTHSDTRCSFALIVSLSLTMALIAAYSNLHRHKQREQRQQRPRVMYPLSLILINIKFK